ncbi:putative hydrolase or acyltransferase of alpha/beta superfamily [Xenococcus sp. PCC 7305]|uniref:alpha/beta fold hydrolase n=1 Tax=Xenococcus sp. PCC 7305 TaxID=102125 RepID=UPI0002ACBCEE|nr:alpha/beta hydrolase [Xenococcus sp. PCC 7305]ELS04265.1 putative hydrolase or acyltransferase of alpha/beta superfamily [Xenococcus sp. PCC 7305]
MIRQTVNLSGIELSYWEWNQGKKPLLLLHGLADCGLVWSSLGDSLAADYHIIAPDLRGHGDSSKPLDGYQFDDFIRDLEALMEHLGWSSANVLAHSWSAKLLTIWSTKNPARFQKLILVDPFFIGTIPNWLMITLPILYQVLPFLKTMQSFASYAESEKLARQLKQYRGWSSLQQQVFQASIEEKPDGTWSSKFTKPARDRIFLEVMQVEGLTKTIDIPTLFIKPDQGLNRLDWQLKPYKTYLSNLQICEVPGNHWAFLVEPEAFNRTVAEFLEAKNII